MTDHWHEQRQTRSIGAILPGTLSSGSKPSTLPILRDSHDEPKPTKATEACIIELALRFPCPRDQDPERYEARLKLLTRDCAGLNPGLLRKACDRTAQQSRFLPTAAEIIAAATAIVEERQRAQQAERAPGNRPTDTLTAALIERNRTLIETNYRHPDGEIHRWANVRGKPELLRCTGRSPQARCNGDGTIDLATWDFRERDWVFTQPTN